MRASRLYRCATSATTGAADAVLCQDYPNTRVLTLNRPKSMNAINVAMARMLRTYVILQPHQNEKAVVVIKGSGNCFTAGGDLLEHTEGENLQPFMGRTSCLQYQTDYHIAANTANTFISLLNGIVMGAGAGIAFNGRYRVACERTEFAMPECSLGFFTNGGTSWLLPRTAVPGLGLYLALTGARLKGADLVHAGLATNYVLSSDFDSLEKSLSEVEDPFYASSCIYALQQKELPPFTLEAEQPVLAHVFGLQKSSPRTVETIVRELRNVEGSSALAKSALASIERASPTSLKVVLEQHKRSAKMTGQLEALTMEVFTAQRMTEEHDFPEGVRAMFKDRTKDPHWNPATLEEVTPEYVKSFFGTNKKGFYVFDPLAEAKRCS